LGVRHANGYKINGIIGINSCAKHYSLAFVTYIVQKPFQEKSKFAGLLKLLRLAGHIITIGLIHPVYARIILFKSVFQLPPTACYTI